MNGSVQITLPLPASSRAAKYAQELGVTRLADEANGLLGELEPLLRRRAFLEQQVRNGVQFQDERERELVVDIASEGTFSSLAAQERELKNRKGTDESYRKLTIELLTFRDELSDVEVAIRLAEHKLRSVHNQMNLLSSHLDYLAAEKQHQTMNRVLGVV